jgi:hypothetical protein
MEFRLNCKLSRHVAEAEMKGNRKCSKYLNKQTVKQLVCEDRLND